MKKKNAYINYNITNWVKKKKILCNQYPMCLGRSFGARICRWHLLNPHGISPFTVMQDSHHANEFKTQWFIFINSTIQSLPSSFSNSISLSKNFFLSFQFPSHYPVKFYFNIIYHLFNPSHPHPAIERDPVLVLIQALTFCTIFDSSNLVGRTCTSPIYFLCTLLENY